MGIKYRLDIIYMNLNPKAVVESITR